MARVRPGHFAKSGVCPACIRSGLQCATANYCTPWRTFLSELCFEDLQCSRLLEL